MMNIAWTAVWFIIAISLLVAVHEFGHYWVARRFGIRVLRFSIGFGPALWRRTGRDKTEYMISAVPLGGYVMLLNEREGEVAPADVPYSFTRKPPWQRILVLLAGPAFNIIFAILVLWGVLFFSGTPQVRAVVGDVAPNSLAANAGLHSNDEILAVNGQPIEGRGDVVMQLVEAMSSTGVAQMQVKGEGGERAVVLRVETPEARRILTEPDKLMRGLGFRFWSPPSPAVLGTVEPGGPASRAGLLEGDRILAVNGEAVSTFRDLVERVSARPGEAIDLRYSRGGVEHSLRITTNAEDFDGRKVGRIHVNEPRPQPLPDSMLSYHRYGVVSALTTACTQAWDMTTMQARMLWRMIRGQVSLKNLSGPLSIAEFAGDSASAGASGFLSFLVLISLSLGFLNLLPIPILDGGQVVFNVAEWLRGKPLSERALMLGHQVGIALLVLLMGVALFNDVSRQLG